MKKSHVDVLVFLTFISFPEVRSLPCSWTGSIVSGGQCFLYNSTKLNYSDAKTECQSKGGVLAKVTSLTQYVDTTSQAAVGDKVWIGANDIKEEGNWVWEDDGTAAAGLWAVSPATNANDATDCAVIKVAEAYLARSRMILDLTCDSLNSFLCMEKDLMTTQDSILSTSTDTSLMPSRYPTSSITPLTTTTINTTDKATTDEIITSSSSLNVPINSLMKCGASIIDFNVLFFLNLCFFNYLLV